MEEKNFVSNSINKNSKKLIKLSDDIFDFAELGFKEIKSSERIINFLEEEGFIVERGITGMPTAFKAVFGKGKPVISFLAEYDALPNLGQKGGCTKPCSTENTNGHGCGHNLIGTGAVAAALVLKEYLEENSKEGTVILFGCPSEEKGNGKTIMVRDGAFEGVDIAFTWHPFDYNTIFNYGTLANVSVYFSFEGTTSHAAAFPEVGRSALDAAELMSVGVNYLREHVIQEARIHYAYIDAGGKSPNVVQGTSKVLYFIRAPKIFQVKDIYKRVVDIAEGAAKMTGTKMSYELYGGLSDFVPNKKLSEILYNSMLEVGAPEFDEKDFELAREFFYGDQSEDIEHKKQTMTAKLGKERAEKLFEKPLDMEIPPLVWSNAVLAGSTDVGDVSYVVPTAQLTYATATAGTASHTWKMTAHGNTGIAHKGMLAAGKAMGLAAIKVYEDKEAFNLVREEWEKNMKGKYDCPLSDDIPPRLDD